MSRPSFSFNTISSGLEGWDAEINDDFTIVDEYFLTYPVALTEHSGDESDLASTFAAASYDRCVIWVDHSTKGWLLYMSDGTSWLPIPKEGGAVSDLSLTVTGPTIGEVQSIADKVDQLLGELRDNGHIAG